MKTLNPFIWDRPIDDPSKIVGMDAFSREVCEILKGQTNVALFGARDTGKTTFTRLLTRQLEASQGDDAPGYTVFRIDLQRAYSIPALCACVYDAMVSHSSVVVRTRARRQFEALVKTKGINFHGVSRTITQNPRQQDTETLHAELLALTKLGENIVVIFDEFQALRHCPGNPLALIRSALMGPGANHVSLLLTGSIRNALEMMLATSTEPLWGEAHEMELPPIDREDFVEFLGFQFEATGKPASEDALLYLVDCCKAHPKRTQQLAWEVWQRSKPGELIQLELVGEVFEKLVSARDSSEFLITIKDLSGGEEPGVNEIRALGLISEGHTSIRLVDLNRVGLTTWNRFESACTRLARKGLVRARPTGGWEIIDPFFEAWLLKTSPFSRTQLEEN